MKNELVHSKKNDVFCDSRIIAEKFGKQHNKIVDKIEWLITKLKEDNEIHSLFGGAGDFKFIKVEKKYRGQSFKCYEMGKKEFLLIAMHISGIKALKYNMANIISMLLMEESLASIYENWAEIPGKIDQIHRSYMDYIPINIPNTIMAEKLYHQRIILNFGNIFPNYKYIQSEYTMADGDIADIIAEDVKTKRPVIIEIKTGSRSAHKQLRSYSYNFDNPILVNLCHCNPKKQVKGIVYVEYP